MVREADILLDCSNELYKLAREAKDMRWKKELLQRAREIGDMRDTTLAVVALKNLVIEASTIIAVSA